MSADTVNAATAARLRPCANCGLLSDGWWCSTECRRAEDGDEREFDYPDYEEDEQ